MKKLLILIGTVYLLIIPCCHVVINPIATMVVKDGDGNIIAHDSGKYDFGKTLINTANTATFTIENQGRKTLELTGDPVVEIAGQNKDDFKVTLQPENYIKHKKYSTFKISFLSKDVSTSTATVNIRSNDENYDPFSFTVTGTGVVPEINVKQNNSDLISGSGLYNFGNVTITTSSPLIPFTIENIGEGNIVLSGNPTIKVIGADSSMFIVDDSATNKVISTNSSTTFAIKFLPTTEGLKTATISITNNDLDENPYIFTVKGNCIIPEIAVFQGSTEIQCNTGVYDFGIVPIESRLQEVTFTIKNLGYGDLILSETPKIRIYGVDASMFTIDLTATQSKIAKNNSTTFSIVFKPTEQGHKSATILITNNDIDENPFIFNVMGIGDMYHWTHQYGNTDGYEEVTACTTDQFGNSYIAGIFQTTLDFGQDFGTTDIKYASSSSYSYVTKINSDGSYGWTKVFSLCRIRSIATDSQGNIYAAGEFRGTINFGDDFGQTDYKTSIYYQAVLIMINYDASYGWTKSFGINCSNFHQVAESVCVDSNGNIIISGRFLGKIDFGADFGVTDIKNANGNQYSKGFITKINSNGTYGWTSMFGGTDSLIICNVDCDTSGNVFATGSFTEVVNFGADFGKSDIKTSNGWNDTFIIKITSNNEYCWTRTIGNMYYDYSLGVKIDSTNNIYITGSITSQTDFGEDFGTTDIKGNLGEKYYYITKITSDGNYRWTKIFDLYLDINYVNNIALDSTDNIYFTGYFTGNVNFASDFGGSDTKSSPTARSAFLTKISSSGTYAWTMKFGGNENTMGRKLTIDTNGFLYLCGIFKGSVDFGGEFYSSEVKTSYGEEDIFVSKLSVE